MPNSLFFEKRAYLYINCLGLLKRLNPLFSNMNNSATDIEVIRFINLIIPNFLNKLKFKNVKLYNLIPIENFEKSFNFNNIFKIKNKLFINNFSFFSNKIFNIIYKNFYKTNIISCYSNNMNILTYSFFKNNSNFRL